MTDALREDQKAFLRTSGAQLAIAVSKYKNISAVLSKKNRNASLSSNFPYVPFTFLGAHGGAVG
jgi:hypothetical protein